MRTSIAAFIVAAFGACAMGASAQQADGTPHTAESVRQAVAADKRGLVEKNMRLTPEELKRFRPVYEEYQRRLAPITAKQNRAVIDFIESEDSMTDANAKRIVQEILEAESEEQKLRERTQKALLAVLPARKAARYLQIENKIRAINRYDIAERMPLVK
jgi:Spy/CpxP family protein refolding chaperone